MRYTWTDEKYRENLRRHHIAFEDAIRIFDDPTVERVDDRFDYGEVRADVIGLANGLALQRHLQNMVFYHKGLRGRKTPLPFVACARKAAMLRGQIWSAHESDVVGLEMTVIY